MKKAIHPAYYPDAKVICACGNTFTTGSTVKEIRVELCSVCHPFYTGKQKLVDAAGRVDKFKKRAELTAAAAGTRVGKRAKKEKQAKFKAQKTIKLDEAKRMLGKKASAKRSAKES